MSIRSEVDDLRDSATYIERMLDAIGKDGNGLMEKVAWLERENEKLREFARRAYSFSYNCYHGAFDQEVFFDLRDRMRELGIEVGE